MVIPDGTKYVAIQTTSTTQANALFIDNFRIGSESSAGEWTTIDPAVSPLNITGLQANTTYDYQVIGVENNEEVASDVLSFTTTDAALELAEDDRMATTKNADLIAAWNGLTATVILTGRTLFKDGAWNTLCLPFNVDDFVGTPLEDATVMTLGNSDACDTRLDAATGTLHLEFLPANKIEAGLPYLVKWESGDDISNPVFNGVTIWNENPFDQSVISKDGAVTFTGSYSPFEITAENKNNILYIGSANKIGHSRNSRTLRSCRAHFELTNPSAAPVRTVVVDYGEEEIVTEIVSMEDGRSQMDDDGWYTLNGIRLNGKPTEKGIYLFNGKKVVIK
jgi:hypothetical protein